MNAPATIEATIETPPRNTVLPALIAGGRPRAIVPTDIDQVWRFAQLVAKSGMAPKDMARPETLTVAILHGLEVGLTPLMALQRIAVINGRPSIWGDGAMGLVRASGLCDYVHETVVGDGERMVGTCRVKRKNEKEAIERTFSAADAKQAGLWGKAGPWQQYPRRMIQMRARAFALRDLFADVLGGLYIAEELEGVDVGEEPMDITPKPGATGGGAKAELPPSVPAKKTEAPAAQAEQTAAASAAATEANRPLPPPARSRKTAAPADDGAIPAFLQRSCPPPADQPEAFREWIVAHVKAVKSDGDLQALWDDNIAPNVQAEQIFPPDLEDLTALFADRRTELANQ